MKHLLIAIVVVTVLWPVGLGADECAPEARKPVKVSGALCGAAFATLIGIRLEDTDVVLRDQEGVLVASVRADSNAEFTFPPLPKGKYRLEVPGFHIYMGEVELTTSHSSMCKQPVILYAGVTYCAAGWVSRKWDHRYLPDGPPKRK